MMQFLRRLMANLPSQGPVALHRRMVRVNLGADNDQFAAVRLQPATHLLAQRPARRRPRRPT